MPDGHVKMTDSNSFTLTNLQRKHPHLSQLNNWTSNKLAEGYFDSCLQEDRHVPGDDDSNAKTQSVLRSLKGNKVSPLAPTELGKVSKLPPIKLTCEGNTNIVRFVAVHVTFT